MKIKTPYFFINIFLVSALSACGGDANDSELDTGDQGTATQPSLPPEPQAPVDPGPTSTPIPNVVASPTPTPDIVPAASCSIAYKMPTAASGCNGISLTDEQAIESVRGELSQTQGDDGHDIFRFGRGDGLILKNEGCYQFGQQNDNFSISLWLKAGEGWEGDKADIITNKPSYSEIPGFTVIARSTTDGKFYISADTKTGSKTSSPHNINSHLFDMNEWTHVVISYDSQDISGKLTVYVNDKSTTGDAHFDIFSNDRPVRIGDAGSIWFSNHIDISEMTFYDTKLTDNEVATLYANGSKSRVSDTAFTNAIDGINKHIDGDVVLTDGEITQLTDNLIDSQTLILRDETYMRDTFDLIENFESTYGALFTTPKTRNGFARVSDSDEFHFERNLFRIQQMAHDRIFRNSVLENSACRSLLTGKSFATAAFTRGTAPLPNPNDTHTVSIDATVKPYYGRIIAFANQASRRPTGKYLSPGAIAKITVPQSMVNSGFSVLVGAATTDHESKGAIRRLDRLFKEYPITSSELYVTNPLGGGIYINVPYLADLGPQEIQLQNVLQAPFFSTREGNKTTLEQWNEYRQSPAPWADFETDNFMMQVPTNWIYAMEDPTALMETWSKAMDGITEFKGLTPEQRNRKVLYLQVDVRPAHPGFNGIGYPQVNQTFNPDSDEQGKSDHFFVNTDAITKNAPGAVSTMFHELTHAEAIFGFRGEVEAIAYLPAYYVRTEKFGMNSDIALGIVNDSPLSARDDIAISWMVTENFRNGQEMDYTSSTKNEIRYQKRGYAKYIDIADLFGWDAITGYYKEYNQNIENGVFEINANNKEGLGLDETDYQILKYSETAGADLRPLIHFWGIHPVNDDSLRAEMDKRGLVVPEKVREFLEGYATIIPKDNAEFREHFERYHPGSPSGGNPDYGHGWYNEWIDVYNDSHAEKAKQAIQDIIDLYYPASDPQ